MATRPVSSPLPWGEFELIDRIFAPLARDLPGAFDLKDDVATLEPRHGHELVLKVDSTIESVHFLCDDPPGTVAQKALRRPLSDLAAKGTTPAVYLLALALPATVSGGWIEKFAEGLGVDQTRFGIALTGGETKKIPGALTITVTMLGWVPTGRLLRRNGAKPGDDVWVTGSLGGAAGGLSLLKNEAVLQDAAARDRLVRRFRVPEPRIEFGKSLRGIASAAIDVSDGLLADVGHVADVSGTKIQISLDRVPICQELRAMWQTEAELRAISGGDDYEIAFTAPTSVAEAITAAARQTHTPVTRIGRVVDGPGGISLLDSTGRNVCPVRRGYTHF